MDKADCRFSKIMKWTCIGLFVRLLLMPFTMHGQDLQFINYFPMMFVTQGAWDPYKFGTLHLPNCLVYYGPGIFLIMSAVNFFYIIVLKIASLAKFLAVAGTMICGNLNTSDYVYAFARPQLYSSLFLMKLPYLFFDFMAGFVLLKFVDFIPRHRIGAYALWMLNVVVLHSAYAIGQFEIIAAFFILAALYAAVRRRPYLCMALLSIGGAVKGFPYVLVLPSAVLLGKSWKKRFFLALVAGLVSTVLYLPFYFSSGMTVFGSFALGRYYEGVARWVLNVLFLLSYCLLLAGALRDSRKKNPQDHLIFYFLVTAFLVFSATPISFRYFVFITPLLALVMPRYKKFGVFVFLSVLLLAFLRLPTRDVQFGLLAPLNPVYFDSLPAVQEFIGRFLNIDLAYKISARLLALAFFACAWWMWRIKQSNDEAANA